MEYIVSIEKEKINEMPLVEYDGNIYIVDSMSQVNAAVAHLRKHPLIGFDTETRPAFKRGERHKLALIQLATPSECFLFRTCKLQGIPLKLKEYLEDENCLVTHYRITDLSLQKIFAILFGKKISKSQRLTNWEADELTPQQQRYAAIDAWACIDIYNHLMDGKFIPEKSPYYHQKEDEQQT